MKAGRQFDAGHGRGGLESNWLVLSRRRADGVAPGVGRASLQVGEGVMIPPSRPLLDWPSALQRLVSAASRAYARRR